MASDAKSVMPQSISDVQDHMVDAHYKDPELSEKYESTLVIHTENNESTQVIQPVLLEENPSTQALQQFHVQEKESTQVIHQAHFEENVSTQQDLLEEKESTETIHPILVEENVSTQVIQQNLLEDSESTEIIQQVHVEENELTKIIHSSLSVQNEIIPTPISEESVSTLVIQPIFSDKTMSSELNQPALSQETKLTAVKQPEVLEEVNLSKEIPCEPFKSRRGKLRLKIPSNNINPSAIPEIVPKDRSSSFHAALDLNNFISLLDTEEYKDAQLYAVPGSGHVIVTPTTPCEPIFPNFVMPSLSPPREYTSEPLKHLSSTKYAKVTEDEYSEKSLFTLEAMISHWIQRGMEKFFNNPEDLIDYSKNELYYGLGLLKQMNKRFETLLRAAEKLPDPSSIWQCQSGSLGNSVRILLIDNGVKMQGRLKELEETIEHFNTNSSLYLFDARLNKKPPAKQQITEARKTIVSFFLKLSEDFISLSKDIENFREHIRKFCSEIDRLL